MKKMLLPAVKAGCCILAAALVGLMLLCAVYLMPTDQMDAHLYPSAAVIAKEGAFPHSDITGYLDNHTDATILLNAAHKNTGSLLENVLQVKRYSVSGMSPDESLVAIYQNGETEYVSESYQRYWHGYLVIVKPLLHVMDFSAIRVLNMVIGLGVVTFAVYLFLKRHLSHLIIPYILIILLLRPVGVFQSLQYSSCFYLMSASVIAMLLLKNPKKHAFYVFLFSGIATAYFDFLTYPLATFGVAAAVYYVRTEDSLKGKLLDFLNLFALWCVGYVGMWASKWILAALLSQGDVLKEVAERLVMRSSLSADGGEMYNLWDAIGNNLAHLVNIPVMALMAVFVVVSLVVFRKRSGKLTKHHKHNLVLFGILAALPIIWYAFTINHSVNHSIFTHKALVVTAFAGMCMASPGKPSAKE